MTSRLLIDFGNSRCKWARQRGEKVEYLGALAYIDLRSTGDLVERWLEVGPVDEIMVAMVAAVVEAEEAISLYRQRSQAPVRRLVPIQDSHGLHLVYGDVDKLGVDRWLAMLGARDAYDGPLCIVDCGTAMTVDVVTAAGQHLGGQILPGLEMMRRSLHRETAHLPNVAKVEGIELLGRDTEACIAAGTVAALAGAVNLVLEQLDSPDEIHGIITGGNARDVLPLLHGQWELRPQLVLEGMAVIGKTEKMGEGL